MPRLKAAKAAAPRGAGDPRRPDRLGRLIGRNATPRKTASQARRRGIPKATTPGFVTINDGQTVVGTALCNCGSSFAFDAAGEHRTRLEAVRALPPRRRS
jgi:hypothetical protein